MFTKRFKGFILLFIPFILSGCFLFNEAEEEPVPQEPTEQIEEPTDPNDETTNEEPEEVDEDSTDSQVNQDLEAWMPRLDNVRYSYVGEGMEYASYNWYPQFNQENYYQTVTDNSGTILAEVFEYRDDAIVRTFRQGEVYYRDNFTSIGTTGDGSAEEVILQLPIEVGTNWSGEEADYEITAVDYEVEVPAGAYETIEVTSTFDNSVTRRYYAEDVGLVLEVTETEGTEISSSLESIETEAAETIPFTVYVPDDQAMGMDTVEAELTLNTNDPARVAITELLSGENPEYEQVNILPEGTQINYLFKNDSGIVEADVSSEFVENMNAGTTGEVFYLTGLANTLIQYYGANEVLLTVDGEPYEGGHIILMDGETIPFDEEIIND